MALTMPILSDHLTEWQLPLQCKKQTLAQLLFENFQSEQEPKSTPKDPTSNEEERKPLK